MALGLLILSDGHSDKLTHKPVAGDKALHYWNVLHGHIEPTEEDATKLMYIVDIKLPPSLQAQAPGYTTTLPQINKDPLPLDIRPVADENSRLHSGVEQGAYQAVPRGDR